MGKVTFGLLFQSVITFIIGIILASQGLPSSQEDASITLGNTLLNETANLVNDPYAKSAAENGMEALNILGIGMSIISALEFIFLLIYLARQ